MAIYIVIFCVPSLARQLLLFFLFRSVKPGGPAPTLSLSLHLSIYLSFYLSVCLSVYIYIYILNGTYMYIYIYVCVNSWTRASIHHCILVVLHSLIRIQLFHFLVKEEKHASPAFAARSIINQLVKTENASLFLLQRVTGTYCLATLIYTYAIPAESIVHHEFC